MIKIISVFFLNYPDASTAQVSEQKSLRKFSNSLPQCIHSLSDLIPNNYTTLNDIFEIQKVDILFSDQIEF